MIRRLLALGLAPLAVSAEELIPYSPVAKADEAIVRLEELGGSVRRISRKSDALEVDLQFCGVKLNDDHLQYLHALDKVVSLHLTNTAITSEGLRHVATLTGLKRLYLAGTAVNDAGLEHLLPLKELEYLNLYNTGVGDPAIETLKPLPKLKKLYLARTGVSDEAIKKLLEARPGLEVSPDAARDRVRLEAVVKYSRFALANSEARFGERKKDFEELYEQRKELQKIADADKKAEDETRKPAHEARKVFDEAIKRHNKLRKAFDEARRKAEKSPDDAALVQSRDEKERLADQARAKMDEEKKRWEELQAIHNRAHQAHQITRKRFDHANKSKERYEDAKKALEASKRQDAEAQRLLAELNR